MASSVSPVSSKRLVTDREYANPYNDFDPCKQNVFIDIELCELKDSFKAKLLENAQQVMDEVIDSVKRSGRGDSGNSIYTGISGIALAALVLGCRTKPKYSEFAAGLLGDAYSRISGHRFSFLNGDFGTLALAAQVLHNSDKQHEILHDRMRDKLKEIKNPSSDVPDELLYGRAGFLYGMLYVNKHFKLNVFGEADIKEVIHTILMRGKSLAKKLKSASPLMYDWHDKLYLGAAHGLVGILYVLLQARAFISSEIMSTLIQPTVDELLSLRFVSGNLPSSVGNDSDRLVHWCHGAPGLALLLTLAYQVWGNKSYLTAAEACSDVVWQRGLLRKGCGLCHGTSGNAYTFLALYQMYKAKGSELDAARHLYRACAFADWCLKYKVHRERLPDRPLSLFEGKCGIVYFLSDIVEPQHAAFPAYTL